jgi:thiol-disulfide isomerase/thioredoxin
MKNIPLVGLICIVLCTGCVNQSQPTATTHIENEIICPCGCELTLRDCEVDDPTCQTRAVVQSQIVRLKKEGKSSQDIIAYFHEPKLPSAEEILTMINTERESGHPVILYFYSETCSTCIEVKPLIQEIEQRFPQVMLIKIEKRLHNTLFTQYHVKKYPQLIIIIEGEEIRKEFSKKDDILTFMEELLS